MVDNADRTCSIHVFWQTTRTANENEKSAVLNQSCGWNSYSHYFDAYSTDHRRSSQQHHMCKCLGYCSPADQYVRNGSEIKEKVTTENVNSSDTFTEEDEPTDKSPRLKRQGHCWKDGSDEFGSVEFFWLLKVRQEAESVHWKHVSTKFGYTTNLLPFEAVPSSRAHTMLDITVQDSSKCW